jgi:hypothetical protein
VGRRSAVLLALAGLLLATTTSALADSLAAPVVVASGQWDGHAWRLEALDQHGLHCYRISVAFPFTRWAPPHAPNCAFSTHGGWNAFTACPLAFAYGIADPSAAKVTVELQSGHTVSARTTATGGIRYFVTRIPCNSRVMALR